MKWKMKNGNEIEIKNMSDEHLINAFRMLQKKAEKGIFIGESDNGLPDFGDMLYGEEAYEYITEYKYLLHEIKRRKLL